MLMIETGRLVLRQWRGEDVAPFAEMNRDVEVMEHMMQKSGWSGTDGSCIRRCPTVIG